MYLINQIKFLPKIKLTSYVKRAFYSSENSEITR